MPKVKPGTERKPVEIPRDEKGNVILPITVTQAALLWGKSTTRIKVLCEQQRVKHLKIGIGPMGGARTILIQQAEPPADVERGTLSPAQKEATRRIKGARAPASSKRKP